MPQIVFWTSYQKKSPKTQIQIQKISHLCPHASCPEQPPPPPVPNEDPVVFRGSRKHVGLHRIECQPVKVRGVSEYENARGPGRFVHLPQVASAERRSGALIGFQRSRVSGIGVKENFEALNVRNPKRLQ